MVNKAMLAKQGWRLEKNPDSMAVKMLQELLQIGKRWQIGQGITVSIYEDHWIARSTTFKVISAKMREDLAHANQLNTVSTSWNGLLIWLFSRS
ncbi:hypothetical protein Dsin_005677 [Dipteronia sinensis]|uniref:Uncharacterized protein n=1 Tax=Dipteronia sinensis TaxID=43782 RepID=A0AAE0AXS0_9ROSI|nr:hypothetical protein Dsin_005677 [Dipteronia sinensis]